MGHSFKSELRKAHKAAKRELHELMVRQQKLGKEIVVARQTLQRLADVCKAAGVQIESSSEAAYLLHKSALGDEVRSILIANYPAWTRPNQVVAELERIGHDLSKLSNPQASIQMILKRMVEGEDAQEEVWPQDGKKVYRMPRTVADVESPSAGMALADIPERGKPSSIRLTALLGKDFDRTKLPESIQSLYGPEEADGKIPADHPLHKLKGKMPK
jgi:biotin operon repressor